ncbi:MAG: acetyl-CoA hydrolase/transferase C-terminal domain-containing protein [Chromatiales bacterium]
MPQQFDDVGDCVDAALQRVGKRIVLALPLALGNPVPLVNELYRRAFRDRSIELKIFTGLSLRKPQASGELERRFLDPFVARVLGNCPELDYVAAVRAGQVPSNIEVIEFFLEPGAYLGNAYAQQHYLSANYTHVARELLAHGVNVVAQMIATRVSDGRTEYSLSCNPDVTVDLLPELDATRRGGREIVTIGVVNRQLPFMFGGAEIAESALDFVVEHARYDYDLYCPPNLAINTVEYLIGLYASVLVKDAGTLQIGIGELGDAIVYCLQQRHQHNATWRSVLDDCRVRERFGREIERIGDIERFERGLYGCTEMFVDGFLDLYRSGILKRRVYGHALVQRLLNEGKITERIDARALERLLEAGLPPLLDAAEFASLQQVGIIAAECSYESGRIRTPQGEWLPADLSDAVTRERLAHECLGARLREGVLLHGGFFLGPKGFYAALRDLPEAERRLFNMTGVGFINQLYGEDAALRIAQRQHARFINTAMMITLTGAAVSDTLDDGQVVSGVGGQYNFVSMAHALPGAHSVLAVRSVRTKAGRTTSNLVFSHGHNTIPRHLRDVVITEYGIAELRGKTDSEVIAAMLNIADARFQDKLLGQAQAAGKLPRRYRIPEAHRNNTPEALERALAGHRRAGLFSAFPFGSDYTAEELVLAHALKRLRKRMDTAAGKAAAVATALLRPGISAPMRPYLQRMRLDRPQNMRERLLQRLVASELRWLLG